MQPSRDPANWQQPNEQPPQAPYVANPAETPHPIVTMSPDQSAGAQWQPQQPISTPQEPDTQPQVDDTLVRWQATEYIEREKSPVWYIIFAVITLALTVLAIFIIKEITFAILVPVMAVALFVYTRRPPRVIDYTLSRQGLHINDRLYSFSEFKGFGVIRGDDEYSVMLLPTKRFKPGVLVYFPEEAGEAIVDMLGARLPMREVHLDLVDRLIRKLRI